MEPELSVEVTEALALAQRTIAINLAKTREHMDRMRTMMKNIHHESPAAPSIVHIPVGIDSAPGNTTVLVEDSSSKGLQIVSATTKPNSICEDGLKLFPVIDATVGNEVGLSDFVLSQMNVSNDKEVGSEMDSLVFVPKDMQNFGSQHVRQNAQEMINCSLSTGKPPPLPPEVDLQCLLNWASQGSNDKAAAMRGEISNEADVCFYSIATNPPERGTLDVVQVDAMSYGAAMNGGDWENYGRLSCDSRQWEHVFTNYSDRFSRMWQSDLDFRSMGEFKSLSALVTVKNADQSPNYFPMKLYQETVTWIFAQLAQDIGDTLILDLTSLHAWFLKSLGPVANSDVSIVTLGASIKFIQCLQNTTDRVKSPDLLPLLVQALTQALNGTSNGIIPMIKVLIEIARYVDQGGGKKKLMRTDFHTNGTEAKKWRKG